VPVKRRELKTLPAITSGWSIDINAGEAAVYIRMKNLGEKTKN
jgi:hypothetical protein